MRVTYEATNYKYRFRREGEDIPLIPIICHGKQRKKRKKVREKTSPGQLFAVFLEISPRKGKFGCPPYLTGKSRRIENQQREEKNPPTGQEADHI